MKSLAKAEALIRDLKDKLSVRYANSSTIDTVAQSKDSNGWPMLFLSDAGALTAGNPVIAIRIKAKDAVSKDIFGNDLVAFTPHSLEISYELTAADNAIPTNKDILIAEYEAIKLGVAIQLKELANGTAVSAANMDAATANIELDELYWPTKGQ